MEISGGSKFGSAWKSRPEDVRESRALNARDSSILIGEEITGSRAASAVRLSFAGLPARFLTLSLHWLNLKSPDPSCLCPHTHAHEEQCQLEAGLRPNNSAQLETQACYCREAHARQPVTMALLRTLPKDDNDGRPAAASVPPVAHGPEAWRRHIDRALVRCCALSRRWKGEGGGREREGGEDLSRRCPPPLGPERSSCVTQARLDFGAGRRECRHLHLRATVPTVAKEPLS